MTTLTTTPRIINEFCAHDDMGRVVFVLEESSYCEAITDAATWERHAFTREDIASHKRAGRTTVGQLAEWLGVL